MNTPAWVTDAIFYQIFPDRFASSARVPKQGLNLEPWEAAPTPHGMKGGDLRGVVDHLDYLQDLGINALYFTPVFASASNHRYHTYDYHAVDPILGGNDALRELVDESHRRGIRVVLDGVFNHASRGFWQFHHTLENGAASPYVDWFHFDPDHLNGKRHWGAYPSPHDQRLIQEEGSLKAIGYQGWWNLPALPKFNTNTPAVREFLFGVAEHWIRFGIDGWRLDVPGEIDDDAFWREFRQRVRAINPEAYIVGEIWYDARRWLKGDQFDASMNYPVAAACLSFFTGTHLDLDTTLAAGGYNGMVSSIDANEFANRIDGILQMYNPEVTRVQLNLLDSHDTPRFITSARGDVDSLKLALTFLFAYPGAPCMFYGDEIGLAGRHDPECRQPFPWDPAKWNHDLLGFVKQLIALRKSHGALRRGNYARVYSKDSVYAFKRTSAEESLLIVLNASDVARTIPRNTSQLGSGEKTVLFGTADFPDGPRSTRMIVPPRQGAVVRL
ncbi:MAG TPA: glycoside hydrolase family 13 protein [Anaerolineales bacterium]